MGQFLMGQLCAPKVGQFLVSINKTHYLLALASRPVPVTIVFQHGQSQFVERHAVGDVVRVKCLHAVLIEMHVEHPVKAVFD